MTAIDMPETTAIWGECDDTVVRGRLPYSWVDERLPASRQLRQLALIGIGY